MGINFEIYSFFSKLIQRNEYPCFSDSWNVLDGID